MSTEPITGLTYQEAGSTQTDALQNAELNYYGAWLNCVVLSVGDTTPPGSPANGDRYIVGTTATGAWATHDDELAIYRDGWQFYAPPAAGARGSGRCSGSRPRVRGRSSRPPCRSRRRWRR